MTSTGGTETHAIVGALRWMGAAPRWMPAVLAWAAIALCVSGLPSRTHASPDSGLAPATEEVARTTPRAALASFLELGDRGDFTTAAHVLDVRALDREDRGARAEDVAASLHDVLRSRGVEPTHAVEDTTERTVTIERVPLSDSDVPIVMSRERLASGERVWVFSRETVAAVPLLHAQALPSTRSWAQSLTPAQLRYVPFLGFVGWQWGALIATVIAALVSFVVVRTLGRVIARRVVPRGTLGESAKEEEGSVTATRLATFASVAVVVTLLNATVTNGPLAWWLHRLGAVALIVAFGSLVARLVDAFLARVEAKTLAESGWQARGVRTRLLVFQRVAHVVGGTVFTAWALVQFEAVRELGVSLLASAGLAGVVLGFAAQRTLGNLIAGMQLSLTQPLRIGDQVTVEGDFGTVEEITLSYVVIRIWDERRLIVPTSRLLEQPFRNHSRVHTEQLGAVFLQCDFETDVPRLRERILEAVNAHPLFDGRTATVWVTDADDRSITLRVLVSARSATDLFALRCAIRERAIELLREDVSYLPRTRLPPVHHEDTHAAIATEPS